MKDLNGCYCEFNLECVLKLVDLGYVLQGSPIGYKFYIIDSRYFFGVDEIKNERKQIWLVNGEFTDVDPNRTVENYKDIENTIEENFDVLLSSKDNDKKEQFAKYGFEVPSFECELFFKDEDSEVYGLIDGRIACYWELNGRCHYAFGISEYVSEYNLTPIKKEWYEEKNNFPCLCWCKFKKTDKNKVIDLIEKFRPNDGWYEFVGIGKNTYCEAIPLTNEEIDSLKKEYKMKEFIQKKNETRKEFLVRIAIYYIEQCADIIGVESIAPLNYDGVDSDGWCLAEDLKIEFDMEEWR